MKEKQQQSKRKKKQEKWVFFSEQSVHCTLLIWQGPIH